MVWEGGRERERKQESVREREGEICFSCYRLVSGANWHRLTSLFHGDRVKKSLATLCPLLSLSVQPCLFLLFQLSCPPSLSLSPCLSAHPAAPMSCLFCLDGLCSSPVLALGSNYTPPPCARCTCANKHNDSICTHAHTQACTVAMRRPGAQTQVRPGSVKGKGTGSPTEASLSLRLIWKQLKRYNKTNREE